MSFKMQPLDFIVICGLTLLVVMIFRTCFIGGDELENIINVGTVIDSQIIPTVLESNKQTRISTTKGEYVVEGIFLVFHGEKASIKIYKDKRLICFEKAECRLLIGDY